MSRPAGLWKACGIENRFPNFFWQLPRGISCGALFPALKRLNSNQLGNSSGINMGGTGAGAKSGPASTFAHFA
jgi:hypothetical protein